MPADRKPSRAKTPSGRGLVIVESPAKAKTIGKFLGKDFVVQASIGHVRDLPTRTSDIPADQRKNRFARLGVDIEHDFEPIYVVPSEKRAQIQTLQRSLKDASALWLATDEDREGEAISWHLLEVLKPKVPVHRLVFHEITEEAIHEALEHPRAIDEDLVEAQETRRILDRLYGYEVSPVLWRKIRTGLSAGRVQSVALRLLVDREQERLAFRAAEWWDVVATFEAGGTRFDAPLVEVGPRRIVQGRDFDPKTGRLKADVPEKEVAILSDREARAVVDRCKGKKGTVLDLEEKPYVLRPSAPFTTSTLQQEAGRKLRFPARRTMGVAQRLYENGVITYMRTDSIALSTQALDAARHWIEAQYGREFLPAEPRVYKSTVKNAQEAHEAVRPAGHRFLPPAEVRRAHGDEAGDLYDLIWKRTIASQMPDARGRQVTARIGVEANVFRAIGRVVEFAGFQRAYVEDRDEADDAEEGSTALPTLAKGQALDLKALDPKGHRTQPPARYTEASLVKELDTRGIGRPSTWASIIDVLLDREYAFKRGTALVPSYTAFAVVRMLAENFGDLLDYGFTARMEDDLDAISRGEGKGREYLRRFYMGDAQAGVDGGRPGLQQLVKTGLDQVDPRTACRLELGKVGDRTIEVRVGKYGLFVTDGQTRAGLPEDTVPDELSLEKASALLAAAELGPTPLGNDPATGKPVYVKTGRFGPYVQLGDVVEGEDKPKMVSVLKGMDPKTLDLATALRLLTLPRDLGPHPEDAEKRPVLALLGRYGPFVKWGEESRSIPDDIGVLDITLDQAVTLLKAPRTRRGQRPASAPLKELGPHPETGAQLKVLSGRYGPYVTDGKINASLRRGQEPASLTIADAVELLRQRAEKIQEGGGKRPSRPRGGGRGPSKGFGKGPAKAKGAEQAEGPDKPEGADKPKGPGKAKGPGKGKGKGKETPPPDDTQGS